jgi:penicillin-binding protein 1B
MSSVGKFLLVTALVTGIALTAVFAFYYIKFSRMIEEKLSGGPFPNTSMLFASPRTLSLGDEVTTAEILTQLRRSGYSESHGNRMGWFRTREDGVDIFPGPDSYFDQEAGVLTIKGNRVARIVSLRDNTERTQYMIEPELITNLFDRKREKRRIVKYPDIPKLLVNAVVSIEDKRFFQHAGFDPLRIIKAAYVDVRKGYSAEGASTLSMQLARGFFLTPTKTWKRKVAETLITLQLEQKLTTEEICVHYAHPVDRGRRGSFAIRGFGEAAQAYFGKDIGQLTLPEAATLAGLIQRPSFTNPYRWPDRARARRNVVLAMMRENGYISEQDYADAASKPINVAKGGVESTDAPYFVDLVNDELQERFQEHDFQAKSFRVYTTLDMNLQQAAAEAVRAGLVEVDALLQNRRKKNRDYPDAQVALVALDPRTGEIKALVGGRNYGVSQLNHAVAKRQPGSIFKPFVYAAALNTALDENAKPITPVLQIVDEPTTFWYDGKPYEPNNFGGEFHGTVNLRQALSKSMNIPTVKVAEMVGYDKVAALARQAGMNSDVRGTPAVALGAYEVTALEMAGAYTVLGNQGVFSKPAFIKFIRDASGHAIYENKPVRRAVLDPRVDFMMVSLMEEVLRSGTGAGARSRGFVLPAAGKTGTSHDGWFAGFTTSLICVVWVGFDDNRELKLEGANSALPIWTEFMKRAHQFREYRNAHSFEAPEGIVSVEIDPATGYLAAAGCPGARPEVFISGTQPTEICRLHGGAGTRVAGWETTSPAGAAEQPGATASAADPAAAKPAVAGRRTRPDSVQIAPPAQKEEKPKEKRGFFDRIKGLFK